MARVFAGLAILAVIAFVHTSLAMPQDSAEKNGIQGSLPVTVLPPAESNADNLRFFFNFWPFNIKPFQFPWIPLPSLNPSTTAATEAPTTPAPAEEEGEEGEGDGEDAETEE